MNIHETIIFMHIYRHINKIAHAPSLVNGSANEIELK